MKLLVYHHKVFLTNASSEALALIKDSLKVFKRNFFPSKENPRKWELIKLYNAKESSFPVGNLELIKDKLDRKKIPYEIVDRRVYPKPYLGLKSKQKMDELWTNQKKALEAILINPSGIIMSPPGTGKSRIILETILIKRVKTLVIVPNQSIQSKMEREFKQILGFQNVTTKAPGFDEESALDIDDEIPEDAEAEKEAKVFGSSYLSDEDKEQEVKQMGGSYLSDDEEDSEPKEVVKKTFGSTYNDDRDDLLSAEEKFLQKRKQDHKKTFWNKKDYFNKNKNSFKKPSAIKKKNPKRNVRENVSVTILCFHSLPNTDPAWLKSIEMVLTDESHHSSASSIRDTLIMMNNAAYRYFYSATHWRDLPEDMQLLISACGSKKLFELSGQDAVAQNLIAKPIMRIIEPESPERYLGDLKRRRDIIDYAIIANRTRNQTIINQAIDLYLDGHVVMISVDEIMHLEILEELMKDKGYNPMTITGQQKRQEKLDKVEQASGAINPEIIIATMAVGEGTDIQNLTACILAAGGQSSTRFLQRITRPSRKFFKNKKGTKKQFIVVDIKDWFNPKLLKDFNTRQSHYKKYFGIQH